jgi:hypothetical protein
MDEDESKWRKMNQNKSKNILPIVVFLHVQKMKSNVKF